MAIFKEFDSKIALATFETYYKSYKTTMFKVVNLQKSFKFANLLVITAGQHSKILIRPVQNILRTRNDAFKKIITELYK